MPVLLPHGRQKFTTATGAPLVGGKLYTYIPGTSTPKATFRTYAGTTANTNPVIADSRGEMAVYWSGDYDVVLKDANNVLIWGPERLNEPDLKGSASAVSTALAASGGAALVGFINSGSGADARTVQARLRDTISAKDFGAVGDGVVDDTASLQEAISEAISTKRPLHIPAGSYKTTATLVITDDVTISGDGSNNTFINLTVSASVPVISVEIPDNASCIGMQLGNMHLECKAGAAAGAGLSINTTATNSAISQSVFHNLFIKNPTTGLFLDGVIYMNTFRNITVSGAVTGYGFYTDSAKEVIYNTFQDCEVTNVGNGAYAYWIKSPASQFRNLTADGCCYFASAYGHLDGLSVEGMTATTPPSTYVVQCNQIQTVNNVAIINIPNAKCGYGMDVLGDCINVSNVRFPDAGVGNQPNRSLNLHAGQTGVISSVQCDRAVTDKLEAYLADSILNGYVFAACDDITVRGLTYQEDSWTPAYATWTTPPTTVTARYVKIGRMVTVTLYAQDGVCNAGSTVTGLPFTSSATLASAIAGACGDTTKRIAGSVGTSATAISNIPALTLTGTYWQLTGSYFI